MSEELIKLAKKYLEPTNIGGTRVFPMEVQGLPRDLLNELVKQAELGMIQQKQFHLYQIKLLKQEKEIQNLKDKLSAKILLANNGDEESRYVLQEENIRLSEKVKELEDMISSHAPEGRNRTNQQYVDLLHRSKELEEALSFYADPNNYEVAFDSFADSGRKKSEVEKDEGRIARRTLIIEEEDKE